MVWAMANPKPKPPVARVRALSHPIVSLKEVGCVFRRDARTAILDRNHKLAPGPFGADDHLTSSDRAKMVGISTTGLWTSWLIRPVENLP